MVTYILVGYKNFEEIHRSQPLEFNLLDEYKLYLKNLGADLIEQWLYNGTL